MRDAARTAFRPLSEKLEGVVRWPYCDVRRLLTVAVGCILEPRALAISLPWQVDGRSAADAEIRADLQAVKDNASAWDRPWTAKRQESLSRIRLTDDGVDELVGKRLEANVHWFRTKLFPEWDSYSADAQLAMMLTAWGIGAAFDLASPPRPALVAAIRGRDWLSAKVHAHLSETNNSGVIERNQAIERCFDNAATVARHGLDPSVLHWPALVLPPVDITSETA